jgi:hypothetical protein
MCCCLQHLCLQQQAHAHHHGHQQQAPQRLSCSSSHKHQWHLPQLHKVYQAALGHLQLPTAAPIGTTASNGQNTLAYASALVLATYMRAQQRLSR